MSKVYGIEVLLCATAYIKADSEQEALAIFERNYAQGKGGDLPTDGATVSGSNYDDPRLPECSLSPAVTFYGTPAHGEISGTTASADDLDLVHDDDDA